MKIEKFTPIIVNGKIIGAVSEDCSEDNKIIPAVIFPIYFAKEIQNNTNGEKSIINLTAILEPPEDENY